MKKLLWVFLLINSVCLSQAKLDKLLKKWNTRNVPYISVETLAMPNTNVILLDARELEEFKVSHLKNAIHVGYNKFDKEGTLKKLPKDKSKKIVVYCSIGIRSETVAYKLIQEGYTNVYNLYGGIFEWKNNDFKVVDSTNAETERVHAYSKELE